MLSNTGSTETVVK